MSVGPRRVASLLTSIALAGLLPGSSASASEPEPSALANARSEALDPRPRLIGGDAEWDYWDLSVELTSGHSVFVRFLITNEGPGERNAVAIGHLIDPDGTRHLFKNGRRDGDWKLKKDHLYLDIGSCELSLQAPHYRLWIKKNAVAIDLDIDIERGFAGHVPASALPAEYSIDLLTLAAPTRGTIQLEHMSQPVTVEGKTSLTHTWSKRNEGKEVVRRIEVFSQHSDIPAYLISLSEKGQRNRLGKTRSQLAIASQAGARLDWRRVEVESKGLMGSTRPSEYWVPKSLFVNGDQTKGTVTLNEQLLAHDPTSAIPLMLRFLFSRGIRPYRVWATGNFRVTLGADPETDPLQTQGSGLTVVTFLNPVANPDTAP